MKWDMCGNNWKAYYDKNNWAKSETADFYNKTSNL